MSTFVTLLKAVAAQKRSMLLIASLPRNDPELARAAFDAGVDVAKIHINVHHHASNTHFGTLDEESLESALGTLAELRAEGKLIGVISHVPAIRERIALHVTVRPLAGGQSRLEGPGVSYRSA